MLTVVAQLIRELALHQAAHRRLRGEPRDAVGQVLRGDTRHVLQERSFEGQALVAELQRERAAAIAGDSARHGPRKHPVGQRHVDLQLALRRPHARTSDQDDRCGAARALEVGPKRGDPLRLIVPSAEARGEPHERARDQLAAEPFLVQPLVVDVRLTGVVSQLVRDGGQEVRQPSGCVLRIVELLLADQELVHAARLDEHTLGLPEREVRQREARVRHRALVPLAHVTLLALVQRKRQERLADRLDADRGALLDVLDRVEGSVEPVSGRREVAAHERSRAAFDAAEEPRLDDLRVAETGFGPGEVPGLELAQGASDTLVVRRASDAAQERRRSEPTEGGRGLDDLGGHAGVDRYVTQGALGSSPRRSPGHQTSDRGGPSR